ncbi:MAG: hypothetical protein K9M45_04905 [Kiritimatiellales bacterium]|nr:hypothetical protein [Kiritimatiellales bacterium]
MNVVREMEISVHPIHGMQLSEGYIRSDKSKGFFGCLPGLVSYEGESVNEVRRELEQEAKKYYGDDVVVDITRSPNSDRIIDEFSVTKQ